MSRFGSLAGRPESCREEDTGAGSLAGTGTQPGARAGLENFEGMAFGPGPDGRGTLVIVSDDNFSAVQRTRFLLFRYGTGSDPRLGERRTGDQKTLRTLSRSACG